MDRFARSTGRDTCEFVSEPLTPDQGAGLASASPPGEPAVPGRFTWRGDCWLLRGVLRKWTTSGPCRNGSAEKYLRRHYYQVHVTGQDGRYVSASPGRSDRPRELVLTIYFERQPRRGQSPKARWYVYTIDQVVSHDDAG